MKAETKKKIAIIYSGGHYFGGIERYLLNLFENIDKNDIELELLSLGEWELTKQLRDLGFKVVIFSQKRINPSSIVKIGQYFKNNNFNLLVSQGVVSNFYARKISFIYGIPNLVTVHSNQADDYSNLLIKTIYKIIDRLTRFPTKKYIVVSDYLKSQMLKSGLSESRIEVVYNGLSFPAPNSISHKGIIIGSIGRLHPVKGYDLLIRAIATLPNKKVQLKIAGVGAELDNLKSLAKELGVTDRVKFVGFKKDIYKFLNGIDIYVQSSVNEGFGLAVIEAMSQRLPVVVTPVGSLKEIIKDGKTGIISKDSWPESLADAISGLIEDPKLSREIGKNARDFVTENFEIKRWVENTVKVYKKASK